MLGSHIPPRVPDLSLIRGEFYGLRCTFVILPCNKPKPRRDDVQVESHPTCDRALPTKSQETVLWKNEIHEEIRRLPDGEVSLKTAVTNGVRTGAAAPLALRKCSYCPSVGWLPISTRIAGRLVMESWTRTRSSSSTSFPELRAEGLD